MVSDISLVKDTGCSFRYMFCMLMQNDLSATEQESFVSVVGVLWMEWRHYCSRFLKYPKWKWTDSDE